VSSHNAASSQDSPELLADARRLRSDRARQVADVLRRQVLAGAFTGGPGGRAGRAALPAESSLASEFGVSRNAVRDALDLLRAEGLVERVPGVGTVVASRKYPHGLDQLLGLAETLHEHGEITNEVRAAGLVTAPPEVAARLREPPGRRVVYLERLRHLNGVPLSLDLTYLAADLGQPLLTEDLVHQDIFVLLERQAGQPLGAAGLTVEAVNADRHSAAVLGTTAGAALLMIERLTHLADSRPVDLEYIRFRGDRLAMRGQLTR
jgi:GntR family transcriptional regulator